MSNLIAKISNTNTSSVPVAQTGETLISVDGQWIAQAIAFTIAQNFPTHTHIPSQVDADPLGSATMAIAAHETTTNHPLVTTTVKGMMSAPDKTKLDGIPANASANATDTQLRDRATHDGFQAISTITNLQTALNNKQPLFGTSPANLVFASPVSGVDAAIPSMRSLVAADIPALDAGKITTGALPIARGGTGAADAATARTNLGINAATWTNLTLQNSWTSTAGNTARFTKLSNGLVVIEGLINKAAKPTSGEVIFTLPAGFRPTVGTLRFRVIDTSVSFPFVEINAATGACTYLNSGTIPNTISSLSLAGIIFYGG